MTRDLRILLAQGCGTCRQLLEKQLSLWALPFDSVANGEDALEHFINNPYDLVLMDLQMPHMDGVEATEQIRDFEERDRAHHVPIVAVTADAFVETAVRCKEAGMCEVVVKTYDSYDLRFIIYYYLGNIWKLRSIEESRCTGKRVFIQPTY